jgi:hypothetical protein
LFPSYVLRPGSGKVAWLRLPAGLKCPLDIEAVHVRDGCADVNFKMTHGSDHLLPPAKKKIGNSAGYSRQRVRTVPGGSLAKIGSAASARSRWLPGSGFSGLLGRGFAIAPSMEPADFAQDATHLPTAPARQRRSRIIGPRSCPIAARGRGYESYCGGRGRLAEKAWTGP